MEGTDILPFGNGDDEFINVNFFNSCSVGIVVILGDGVLHFSDREGLSNTSRNGTVS